MPIVRHAVVMVATLLWAWPAWGQLAPSCGSLANAYGPFDYTDPRHRTEMLPRVESAHFDSGVESLRGHRRYPQNLAGDLDYTLRAFPNHPRALYAMARYYLTKTEARRKPMRYSVECYFERAMAFKPSDGMVRMVYGIYLYKAGKLDEAVERLQEAEARLPDSAEVHYNLGLVLIASKDYAKAKEHAVKAYDLGHPMPGLRNKLKRVGAW